MLLSGIQTLTLLDFPEKVAALVFTAGCNFRCGFCHNPEFVDPDQIRSLAPNFIPEEKFFRFLDSRKNFLDGVVISGGEPTLQPDLFEFIQKIKSIKKSLSAPFTKGESLEVKLDTNGTNPEILEKLLSVRMHQGASLLDYVAMDVKSSPENFEKICRPIVGKRHGVSVREKIEKSKKLIMNSGIDYEFRTTVIREFHDESEILKIGKFIRGAKKFTLQNFRPQKTLDQNFSQFHGFSETELQHFKKIMEPFAEKVLVLS